MKSHLLRTVSGAASFALLLVIAAGCSRTPEATPPASASDPQLTNSRITAIQNDPRMSLADKQRAIETLKSRQSGSGSSSAPH